MVWYRQLCTCTLKQLSLVQSTWPKAVFEMTKQMLTKLQYHLFDTGLMTVSCSNFLIRIKRLKGKHFIIKNMEKLDSPKYIFLVASVYIDLVHRRHNLQQTLTDPDYRHRQRHPLLLLHYIITSILKHCVQRRHLFSGSANHGLLLFSSWEIEIRIWWGGSATLCFFKTSNDLQVMRHGQSTAHKQPVSLENCFLLRNPHGA